MTKRWTDQCEALDEAIEEPGNGLKMSRMIECQHEDIKPLNVKNVNIKNVNIKNVNIKNDCQHVSMEPNYLDMSILITMSR